MSAVILRTFVNGFYPLINSFLVKFDGCLLIFAQIMYHMGSLMQVFMGTLQLICSWSVWLTHMGGEGQSIGAKFANIVDFLHVWQTEISCPLIDK